MSRTSLLTWTCAIAGIVAVLLIPSGVSGDKLLGLLPFNNYSFGVLTFIAINTILAVGLNLLMGYAGQVSLGHAAFFGIGAYTSAVLTTHYHLSPWLAIVVGILLASVVALFIGIPCLRLRGHYLAMATLGFGWIVYIVFMHWDAVTLGPSGIEGIPKLSIGRLVFDNDVLRFQLAWVIAILVLAVAANLVNSRVGRALRALHGSEAAAASLGVDIAGYKIKVFMLSAAFASLAGSLYAHIVNFISPSAFGFGFSVELVVMVVVGGMASVWGALLGAGTITLLGEWLRSLGQINESLGDMEPVAFGAILILVMIFLPAGLTCGIRDLCSRMFRRMWIRKKAAVKSEEAVLP
ncbi:MAG: branched-chain amino acid ABC transporter permease [Armatimonadota bacterium]